MQLLVKGPDQSKKKELSSFHLLNASQGALPRHLAVRNALLRIPDGILWGKNKARDERGEQNQKKKQAKRPSKVMRP